MEKYSKEWKIKKGVWVQKHRDAAKGNLWKIHYIENDTEYSTGEFFTARDARSEMEKLLEDRR